MIKQQLIDNLSPQLCRKLLLISQIFNIDVTDKLLSKSTTDLVELPNNPNIDFIQFLDDNLIRSIIVYNTDDVFLPIIEYLTYKNMKSCLFVIDNIIFRKKLTLILSTNNIKYKLIDKTTNLSDEDDVIYISDVLTFKYFKNDFLFDRKAKSIWIDGSDLFNTQLLNNDEFKLHPHINMILHNADKTLINWCSEKLFGENYFQKYIFSNIRRHSLKKRGINCDDKNIVELLNYVAGISYHFTK